MTSLNLSSPVLAKILKSGLSLLSVKVILGLTSVNVRSPEARVPVVVIFCDPKSGLIFVPAIAALAFISELVIDKANLLIAIAALAFISAFKIEPSNIFALVTVLSAGVTREALTTVDTIKKLAPFAGAAAKIISSPFIAKPSDGWLVPELGFCITPSILTSNCAACNGALLKVNL